MMLMNNCSNRFKDNERFMVKEKYNIMLREKSSSKVKANRKIERKKNDCQIGKSRG